MTDELPESPLTAAQMAEAGSRFLAALTDAQRREASFDFADDKQRRDWSFLPVPDRDGLRIGSLDNEQRKLAHELIVSGTSMPGYAKVVSVIAMEHVLRALTAAWAGDTSPGGRHYFRIQGPTVLIEHDNTQAGGDHIHSVWRHPDGDFGDDVLAEHHRRHHRSSPTA